MKKQPAWKAENARIRKEMAARRKPAPLPFKVVEVPLRTAKLRASFMFSNHEAHFLPKDRREDMARNIITRKLAEGLPPEFISMECTRDKWTGAEVWTGTLLAVKEKNNGGH